MKYNILVIEENSHAFESMIVSTLARDGFDVATAASSQEVASTLDKLKPQLIILGEGLPINSFKACSQLRRAVNVPIIIIGAVLSDRGWNRVVEAGADCYLPKPFGYGELVARVKALLRRHEWSNGNNRKEVIPYPSA